ncbi:MAG: alpha/beta hydrolase [Rhodobacteraceae bacterium]|nr:alpha/beta hydrolase [Paracoccaceae bacterium]
MIRWGCAWLASCAVFAASMCPAAAQTAPSHEIMTLMTADGVQLPAVLSYPASGFNANAPVIVHIPDGPGLSPLDASSPARFVADALALKGYGNLSLETRLSTSYPFSRFDETVTDIKAAVDALAGRGAARIVLAGHGLGSLEAARYLVETGDPRVRGLIHFAPSQDLADAWRAEVGDEKYWQTVDSASRAVNEGDRTFVNLGGGLIFTPPTFLDWYGPTAKTSLTANLASIDQPMLLIAGEDDPAVPKGRLQELKAIAFLSQAVTTKTYPGVGHNLKPVRDELVKDAVAWLTGLGLGTVPEITTELVDVTAEDGVPLSGVLYHPAAAPDPSKPAFILVHGWTSDIMRSTAHWLAVRLAQRGYTALSIRHRGSGFRGAVTGKLEDTPKDIRAWLGLLDKRGSRNVVGVGHSAGNLWLSYYLAQTHDPRIKALVYLAPQRDLPQHARTAMGEDLYARTVLEAQEAVRDGEGGTHLIDAPFPRAIYDDDARQPMFISAPQSGFTYYYADAFLSYWGPNSKAVHTDLIKNVDLPLLALGGSRDPFMQGAYLIKFTEAAGPKASYIFYGGPDGAPHSFEGFERRVTDDILAWIGKTL